MALACNSAVRAAKAANWLMVYIITALERSHPAPEVQVIITSCRAGHFSYVRIIARYLSCNHEQGRVLRSGALGVGNSSWPSLVFGTFSVPLL